MIDCEFKIKYANTPACMLLNLDPYKLCEFNIKRYLPADILDFSEIDSYHAQIEGKDVAISSKSCTMNGRIIGHILRLFSDSHANRLKKKPAPHIQSRSLSAKLTFDDIIGVDKATAKIKAMAKKYSLIDCNILVVGETGTGKEIFSQAIHNASSRGNGPFVAVNCAAFPENLLDSELFGYTDGAFTGAIRGGKRGLFEQASSGTLLLDEINELPPHLQAKLLRVLQEGEIRKIGDNKTIPVDVRVIATANQDMLWLIEQKQFRKDLYYRLGVITLKVPPLRERKRDIAPLALHFLQKATDKYSKPGMSLSQAALEALTRYSWPGNIRQLNGLIEHLVIINDSPIIDGHDLFNDLPFQEINALMPEELSDAVIKRTLQECNGNKVKTAARLGISRSTLWRRLSAAS